MRYLSIFLLGLLGVGFVGLAAADVTESPDAGAKLITKITQGKANITKEFPAVGNLNGYVLTPNGGGGSMIAYADSQGKYMVLGNIIDPAGKNLSAQYNQEYVVSVTAKNALNAAKTSAWFVDGKDSAPHQAYIFLDPNCIYCHLLYKEVFPLIDSGQLQVRWIPVGFLKQTSPGKSAALMQASAKNADTAEQLLRQDELKFDTQKEEGGIQPLSESNKDDQGFFKQVAENTVLFNQYGFEGTPTLIYVDGASGKPAYYPGYLGGKDFQNLVNSMGKAW